MQTQDHQSSTGSQLGSTAAIPASPLTPHPVTSTTATGISPTSEPAADTKKEQELRLKFAEETHQYVREYIRFADQKATFFFAGATALLAYLHKLGMANRWAANPKAWLLVDVLAFTATIGLTISAIACLSTIIPRLNGSRRGLIFFSAIREYDSAPEYAMQVIRQSPADLCDAKLRHIYELAGICREKYAVLKWGQWFGAVGVVATLLLLILQ